MTPRPSFALAPQPKRDVATEPVPRGDLCLGRMPAPPPQKGAAVRCDWLMCAATTARSKRHMTLVPPDYGPSPPRGAKVSRAALLEIPLPQMPDDYFTPEPPATLADLVAKRSTTSNPKEWRKLVRESVLSDDVRKVAIKHAPIWW